MFIYTYKFNLTRFKENKILAIVLYMLYKTSGLGSGNHFLIIQVAFFHFLKRKKYVTMCSTSILHVTTYRSAEFANLSNTFFLFGTFKKFPLIYVDGNVDIIRLFLYNL